MSELKTFGELSIKDRLYVFCKNNGNFFTLLPDNLKPSEWKKNHIEVKDDNNEVTDLPCDETFYEDENFIYSTDKKHYDKWCIPGWEKEIKSNVDIIAGLQMENDELRDKISKASQ